MFLLFQLLHLVFLFNSVIHKSGYKDSKYAIAVALINYPKDKWTKKDIEEATQKAADRIVDFIFNK